MNANQFLALIENEEPVSKADFLKTAKLQESFPYFLIPHILSAKFETGRGIPEQSESIGSAAVNTANRELLQQILLEGQKAEHDGDSGADLLPESKATGNSEDRTQSLRQLDAKMKSGVAPRKKATRRKSRNDELIENLKRKDKKPIKDENLLQQRDLIKAFSKKSIKLAAIKEIETNKNKENLAEPSTLVNDNLVSEPLANLLSRQGKKDEAREIYEKLILKFPDKSTYFADLIEKLKD